MKLKPLTITQQITREDSDNIQAFLRDIERFKVLSASEEQKLIGKAKAGDKVAREKVINHNLRFVVSVAKQYQWGNILLMDLVQSGVQGLIKAYERYDIGREHKLITYAVWWIRQSILEKLPEYKAPVQYPNNFHTADNRIKNLRQDFYQRNEREATTEEILDMLPEAEHRVLYYGDLYNNRFLHLDRQSSSDDNSTSGYDIIPNPNASDPTSGMYDADTKTEVSRLLDGLKPRDYFIITRRFGLNGHDVIPMPDIAEELNLTTVRIGQILHTSLIALKKRAEILGITPEMFGA